jgi:hypothetical protein
MRGALVIAIVLASSPALAQSTEASASMSAAARDLYQEGVQAAAADDFERAIAAFERSYALSPRDATLFNLAQVEEQAGHLVAALDAYHRFVARAEPDMADRYGDRARTAASALELRVAHLTVMALGIDDGDVVRLDGTELTPESLGVALPVDPGHHEVTITRGEDSCATDRATLGEGARGDIELRAQCPVPEPVIAPAAALLDVPAPAPESHDDTPLFVGLGIGGGVVVVGVIVLVVALTTSSPAGPMPFVGNVGPGTFSAP